MVEISVMREPMLEMVSSALDVPVVGRDALIARVRLLHRLGIPTRGRAGAHQRLQYSLREVVEVTLALALMNVYVPPILSARYVVERWHIFRTLAVDGLLLGTRVDPGLRADYSSNPPMIGALIEGNVMPNLGMRGSDDVYDDAELSDVRLYASRGEVGMSALCPSAIIVEARSFAPFLGQLWLSPEIASPSTQREMLDRLLAVNEPSAARPARNPERTAPTPQDEAAEALAARMRRRGSRDNAAEG